MMQVTFFQNNLSKLESDAIEIMREVVSEANNPVMLYSVGKDSAVMLHLAKKAFFPSPPPFPLLHIDTTWKFQEMYNLRDRAAQDAGMQLIVHQNSEAMEKGINPFEHGPLHTDMWKTDGLKQALDEHGFDAAFGGARRDEEISRAKERVFPFVQRSTVGTQRRSARSYGRFIMPALTRERASVFFPLSNWTELDIWLYIHREQIEIVPLYLAASRPTVKREWHAPDGG